MIWKLTGVADNGPTASPPTLPSIMTRLGVKAEFTAKMVSSIPILWNLALSMSGNVPYIFFMARVTPVRRWVFMAGTEIITSASISSLETFSIPRALSGPKSKFTISVSERLTSLTPFFSAQSTYPSSLAAGQNLTQIISASAKMGSPSADKIRSARASATSMLVNVPFLSGTPPQILTLTSTLSFFLTKRPMPPSSSIASKTHCLVSCPLLIE